MMPIKTRCGHCRKRIRIADSATGKMIKCPACGKSVLAQLESSRVSSEKSGVSNPLSHRQAAILGAGFVLVVVVLAVVGIVYLLSPSAPEALREQAAAYVEVPNLDRAGCDFPYVRGKIVTVNISENRYQNLKRRREIDPLRGDLPVELRGESPEEIGVAVWLDWTEHRIGSYGAPGSSGGVGAYVYLCQATLVDLVDKRVLVERAFRGEAPDTRVGISRVRDVHGDKPTRQIVDWLSTLPRVSLTAKAPSASSLAADAKPLPRRTDGLYTDGCWHYLRFYADGTAMHYERVSLEGTVVDLDKIVPRLQRKSDAPNLRHGSYTRDGNRFRFAARGPKSKVQDGVVISPTSVLFATHSSRTGVLTRRVYHHFETTLKD
ncbi:MAG: hypothetical protein FJ271_31405 [Planctomycetes bacterium]|nr:hypothetical protein [Planctomycetota bacterium]